MRRAASQVGSVSSSVTATILFIPTPLTITGEVYNLKPAAGEPARLGIALDAGFVGGISPVYLQSPIPVRVADAGLDSVTDNVPNTRARRPAARQLELALTLWG